MDHHVCIGEELHDMHDPDDIHDSFEWAVLAIDFVAIRLMINQVHHARWQNYKDEVESKPSDIQPFISEEVLGLLLDIWIVVLFFCDWAAAWIVYKIENCWSHVSIKDNCFHEHPEVSWTSCLNTCCCLSDFWVLAFKGCNKSPLGQKYSALINKEACTFKNLWPNLTAGISVDKLHCLDLWHFCLLCFLFFLVIIDKIGFHAKVERYNPENEHDQMRPALDLESK